MSDAPVIRRHRFQFGLGTLLFAITLLAAWLSWEMNYIRGRRTTIHRVAESGGGMTTASDLEELIATHGLVTVTPVVIPFWRRMLGDEAVEAIRVPSNSLELLKTSAELFPEVEILTIDVDDPLQRPIRFRSALRQ
jgi:hypothetical protein